MTEAVSNFDPALFLDATSTEVNEKRPTIPAENPASPDGLYTAVIGEVKMESGIIGKGEKTGRPWLMAVIPLKMELPPQIQALGLSNTFQITDRAFIDLTEQNTIDNSKGKNRGQKMYRDALDMNKPGDVWAWRKATGQVVKVKLVHEIYEGSIVEKVGNILKA